MFNPVIVPNPPLDRFAFGFPKLVLFKKLNASIRNSVFNFSVMWKSLCSPKFN